ncbi:hypothetical protein GCM10010275_42810 [Streptomyces litmocidini]|uniref:hypothetical protein n=1 Tax=Streptomyces litmocidini TaxID=67318 RepID=UPI00167EA66B|nr:hypothetical protein [Streptomyces litmocidini]GGU99377.1 hypothetical protein GCM10010275_42810 [Streptomyces litmocidini]
MVARDTAGVLWKYTHSSAEHPSSGPFDARVRAGGGWSTYDTLAGTEDLGRWNGLDLLARTPGGDLYAYRGKPSGSGHVPATRTKIGWGWNIYDLVLRAIRRKSPRAIHTPHHLNGPGHGKRPAHCSGATVRIVTPGS